jgi:hypothetical protein
LALTGEANDAIGDGEFWMAVDFRRGVLADQQRRPAPTGNVDGEIVNEGTAPGGLAEEIVDSLEAINGHQVGLLGFNTRDHLGQRPLGVLRPDGRGQVDDDNTVIEEVGIEEAEELHVAHELERGLRERREVQRLLTLSGQVKEEL